MERRTPRNGLHVMGAFSACKVGGYSNQAVGCEMGWVRCLGGTRFRELDCSFVHRIIRPGGSEDRRGSVCAWVWRRPSAWWSAADARAAAYRGARGRWP